MRALSPASLGIMLILCSQLAFALMDSSIKLLGRQDIELPTILFFRNIIPMILLLPLFIKSGALKPSFKRLPLHALRSLSGLIGMYLVFLSIILLPLSEATILRSISPLFIPLLAFLWLKEKLSMSLIPCFMIAIMGTWFLSGLDKPNLSWLSLLPIGAGIFTAFAMVSIKRMSNLASGVEIVFYFSFFGSIASAIFWKITRAPLPETILSWLIIIAMALFATLGQITLTTANKYVAASVLAPFYYLNAVFGALLSHFFWNETMGVYGWIGAGLVVLSGILLSVLKFYRL